MIMYVSDKPFKFGTFSGRFGVLNVRPANHS
nr:MAG TPA: hypothetical protein [Caudoviricetes sp.]